MKIMAVFAIQLFWIVFLFTYSNSSDEIPNIQFPTFDTPNISFRDVSQGCGGFVDCIEYVGAVLYNVAGGVIFIILFLIELIQFTVAMFVLLTSTSFAGIDGAPWQFNVVITVISGALLALLLYFMVRSGKGNAD
jgi:hypothetical protein